ncbi:tRNA preQ1(34) S-adenosylmethionine ribosyltransferase-isomerase QueA [Algihabitans albus]|uniref:tRNA preQ1(34) S-adenosylmethionine ribosyltransferase-isomerase QueA n=1 Tax=Algihabitans albus TaxID=2164067 RepID=UPI000E5CB23E|nr:tRNA preQ1(34) S-adenosylmethionine ribosyltransferase-isomerase QueA [Algihabitans albus]
MNLNDFDFHLPTKLIAQRPVAPRDAARLLQVDSALTDRGVKELPNLLSPGDLLVFNDTRVIPARLVGRKGAGKVEITLHKQAEPDSWYAFAKPAKKLQPGDRIDFEDGFAAKVVEKGQGGEARLTFDRAGMDLLAALHAQGTMPLPPYIKRTGGADAQDRSDYQTIYAAREGAVAAPTAGLHFTPELLAGLEARGVKRATLTLHVGAGTFLPVKTERVADHRMHTEVGEISPEAAAAINATKADGKKIVSVGTTSLRLLEHVAGEDGQVAPFTGETDLFILPGYRFKLVDRLMTNFHLPRSTLFMLVCAFAGKERMTAAYAHAVAAGYRFYSYGDSSLLDRA